MESLLEDFRSLSKEDRELVLIRFCEIRLLDLESEITDYEFVRAILALNLQKVSEKSISRGIELLRYVIDNIENIEIDDGLLSYSILMISNTNTTSESKLKIMESIRECLKNGDLRITVTEESRYLGNGCTSSVSGDYTFFSIVNDENIYQRLKNDWDHRKKLVYECLKLYSDM